MRDMGTLYCTCLTNAPVAQMDRVLVSEAKGRGFDSRRAHQSLLNPGASSIHLPCFSLILLGKMALLPAK